MSMIYIGSSRFPSGSLQSNPFKMNFVISISDGVFHKTLHILSEIVSFIEFIKLLDFAAFLRFFEGIFPPCLSVSEQT